MVHCPIFLKKEQGVSITELLIVVTFIAALATAFLIFLNPGAQMSKARDARRKSDLSKLKNVLEDYYNDNKCYPPELTRLAPDYLNPVPVDPATKQPYRYFTEGCDKYWIYVKLEYEKDPAIAEVGCQSGCGPGGSTDYNFGVTSANTRLESGACRGDWWACQEGGVCNNFGRVKPNCPPGAQAYCDDSSCGGGCESQTPCQ